MEEHLENMGNGLAAYVLERMCSGVEARTFKDVLLLLLHLQAQAPILEPPDQN